jgi:hypothetical protein
MERLDIGDLAELMAINPGEEAGHGMVIGLAGVLVAYALGQDHMHGCGYVLGAI